MDIGAGMKGSVLSCGLGNVPYKAALNPAISVWCTCAVYGTRQSLDLKVSLQARLLAFVTPINLLTCRAA